MPFAGYSNRYVFKPARGGGARQPPEDEGREDDQNNLGHDGPEVSAFDALIEAHKLDDADK